MNDSNKSISISRKTFRKDAANDKDGIESVSELELDANGDAHYLVETQKNELNFTLNVKYLDQVEEFGGFYIFADEEADSSGFEPELTNLNVKVLTEK